MKKPGNIKVFNLFFSMLFISLFAYGCNAEGTPTKDSPPTPETEIDPLNLLKGELLQDCISNNSFNARYISYIWFKFFFALLWCVAYHLCF